MKINTKRRKVILLSAGLVVSACGGGNEAITAVDTDGVNPPATKKAANTTYINAGSYASGNGRTDDTAGIIRAEAAAHAANLPLLFPSGKTFLYSGTFNTRVSLLGYGATLKQRSSTFDGRVATVRLNALTNVYVKGLTIDSINKRIGILIEGCIGTQITDVIAINNVNQGFANYANDDTTYQGCKAIHVRYNFTSVPQAGGAADGFGFFGCSNVTAIDCRAEDVRRIGFVADSNGTDVCDQVTFLRCYTFNANHCDDSTTEYNGAFWCENTNNFSATDCTGDNISSGVGQTSGRVIGLIISNGQTGPCAITVAGCKILNNATRMPNALITLAPDVGALICRDCFGSHGSIGLVIAGHSPTPFAVSNFTWTDVTTPLVR
jgi:hypothetical protein